MSKKIILVGMVITFIVSFLAINFFVLPMTQPKTRTIHVIIEQTVNDGYAVYYRDYFPDRGYGLLIFVSDNLTLIGDQASADANFVSTPVEIVMPRSLHLTFNFNKKVTFTFY